MTMRLGLVRGHGNRVRVKPGLDGDQSLAVLRYVTGAEDSLGVRQFAQGSGPGQAGKPMQESNQEPSWPQPRPAKERPKHKAQPVGAGLLAGGGRVLRVEQLLRH